MQDLVSELSPHTAVDDEVDGRVEHEEDVVGGEEDVEGHGHRVETLLVAVQVVDLGLVRGVGHLVHFEG